MAPLCFPNSPHCHVDQEGNDSSAAEVRLAGMEINHSVPQEDLEMKMRIVAHRSLLRQLMITVHNGKN